MATSKLQVILELKDRLTKGVNKAKGKVNNTVRGISSKMKQFSLESKEAFKGMVDQIPGLGNALSLLSNPYALATAGAVALGVAMIALGSHLFAVSSEIREQTSIVKTYFQVTGAEADKLTAKTMALSKTFKDVDSTELVKSASVLQKTFKDSGLSAADSMQLVEQAMLATNGKIDLTEIQEYAVQMKGLGMTASETLGVMVDGFKKGVFGDKAPDALKEAGLSLKEMTKAQSDAVKGIGLDPTKIIEGLKTGKKTGIDIIREISGAMAGASTQAQQTAIADLFKGAGEDAGKDYLLSLKDANFELSKMIDYQSETVKRQQKKLRLNEDLVKSQQKFAPVFNKMADWWDEIWLKIQIIFYDGIGGAIQWFTDLWSGSFSDAASALNPVTSAFGNIKMAIGGVVIQARVWWNVFRELGGFIVNVFKGLWKVIVWVGDKIGGWLKELYDKAMQYDFVSSIVNGAKMKIAELKLMMADLGSYLKTLWSSINELAQGNVTKAKEAWDKAELKRKEMVGKNYADEVAGQVGKQYLEDLKNLSTSTTKEPDADQSSDDLSLAAAPTEDPVTKVATGASQSRSLTINIEALHKGDNIIHSAAQAVGMGVDEFKKWYAEMLLGEVRDIERSY